MFKKKTCKRCKEKINEKFDFCPHCGNPLNEKSDEDYGMLGKNDFIPEQEMFQNNLFGGLNGKILNKMLGGAMKMLEKEMQREIQGQPTKDKTNFELYINGKRINPKNIKVTRKPLQQKQIIKTPAPIIPPEKLKNFSKLPKKEPTTNVRRLSDKVVYEIEIPGVKSIKDIQIVKLENSIEIKAVAKDTAYNKIIAIDLPIQRYKLDKEKLILELDVKN